MSDELIRREDALELMRRGIDGYGQKMRDATVKAEKRDWQSMLFAAVDIGAAIRALPAVSAKHDFAQPDAREAALREAASYHELLAADEDALSAKYRGGSSPWFAHVQRASWHREHASAILALNGESHE